jgi:hypothetical protein
MSNNTGRQTYRQTVIKMGRLTDRLTDRQICRQAGKQAGRQGGRQTHKQTNGREMVLVWLLLYAHRHRSILKAAGHLILAPANQLMEE